MSNTLVELSKGVECNPRSIKRLVNLLQIISELGKIKPAEKIDVPIAEWLGGQPWTDFSPKIVAWILMAQNFPFRLSTLVQILMDFEQKKDFNEARSKRALKESLSMNGTFSYERCKQFEATVASAQPPSANTSAPSASVVQQPKTAEN
jgi:hypothetical protein